MNPENQALIEAHVERLVEVELAHRKEIATLQAMVMELRGRLGEAERLLSQVARGTNAHPACPGCGKERDVAHGSWCPIAEFLQDGIATSPPDSPAAALPCGCIAHPWGGSCPKPAAPPVSTVDSRLAALEAKLRDVDDRFNHNAAKYNAHLREHDALEARVAALETWRDGQAEAFASFPVEFAKRVAMVVPAKPEAAAPMCCDIACRYFGQRHETPHDPREAEAPHAFVGEGSATGHYLGRCRECHCEPSAAIHAVPGAAKP